MHSVINNNFTGKVLYVLSDTSSTNSYAHKLLAKTKPVFGLPEGTAILALEQTSGRGQFGRKWEGNAAENIYLSVIFYPDFLKATENFELSRVISLAIVDFLKAETKADLSIKWPNDIYAGDRKICGILIENGIMGEYLHYTIAGIGININQEQFNKDIPNPISLKNLTKRHYNVIECTKTLFGYLEHRYLMLKEKRLDEIRADYNTLLFKKDRLVTFEKKDQSTFQGKVLGTDDSGHLLVETSEEEKRLNFGEVKWM